jgi:hypothetical protein
LRSATRVISAFILIVLLPLAAGAQSKPAAKVAPGHPSTGPIPCRVMERHMDKEHGLALVLFHQQNKPDQPRLKDFLVQHDGGTIEIQTGSADWQKVAVWRIRNCFGRGLLVVADSAAPKEKAIFKIRAAQ